MANGLLDLFKKNGYKTSLVCFGVENIDVCMSRVMQRESLGGHNVSLDLIKFNYTEGIKRKNESLKTFDNIVFVDNSKTRQIS
jgi:Uncharacterized protein conserved in bacteria